MLLWGRCLSVAFITSSISRTKCKERMLRYLLMNKIFSFSIQWTIPGLLNSLYLNKYCSRSYWRTKPSEIFFFLVVWITFFLYDNSSERKDFSGLIGTNVVIGNSNEINEVSIACRIFWPGQKRILLQQG